MQSDFVANASHELRTPLSIISGFIETLQTSAKDDEEAREKFLKIMSEQAEYMSSLIENLLSLSKIEMSQDQKPDEPTDVRRLIEEVAQALSLKAKEREISIKTELAEQAIVWCDEVSVHTIIRNLLSNAIKFTPTNGTITVSTATVDAFSIISVSDSGVGMSEETISKIFYKNVHHTSSGTANEQGTGLGLMLVKDFVNRNNGDIHVKSTEGVGTTITVKLPVNK
jgi:two-component system phosphate regulon sensor histidine kinase PhoR